MVDAKLLRQEIEEMGIKQSTLAEKCGVSRQTMNKWLSNPCNISIYHAKVLADALRITDSHKLLAIFFAPNVENDSTNDE